MEDQNVQTNQEEPERIFELEEQRRINSEQEEGNEDGIRNGINNIEQNANQSTENETEDAQRQIVVPQLPEPNNMIKIEPIQDVQFEDSKNFIKKKFIIYRNHNDFTDELMKYLFDENQTNKIELKPFIPLNNSRNFKSIKEINEQKKRTKENKTHTDSLESQKKSVQKEQISNNQVPSEQVSNNQVPSEPISNNQIPSEQVSNNQVQNEQVSNNQVQNEQVSINPVPNEPVSINQVPNEPVSINQVPSEQVSINSVPNEPVSNNLVPNGPVSNNLVQNEPASNNSFPNEPISNNSVSNEPVSNNQVSISSDLNQIQYYMPITLVDKIYYDKNKIIAIYKELYGYKIYAFEYTIGENSNSKSNWFVPNRSNALTYVYNYYWQKYALNQFGFNHNFGYK